MAFVNYKKNGGFTAGTPEVIVPALTGANETFAMTTIAVLNNDGTSNATVEIEVAGIKIIEQLVNPKESYFFDMNLVLVNGDAVKVTSDVADLNIFICGIQE